MLLFILQRMACNYQHNKIQIHLMLLFIETRSLRRKWAKLIQIHLMLLFIPLLWNQASILFDSNTSHVIVYLAQFRAYLTGNNHSNTSHVIVYLSTVLSVYSFPDSNTSHVIVYLVKH